MAGWQGGNRRPKTFRKDPNRTQTEQGWKARHIGQVGRRHRIEATNRNPIQCHQPLKMQGTEKKKQQQLTHKITTARRGDNRGKSKFKYPFDKV